MEDQAIQGPSQGMSETQAVELLRQRRAAARGTVTQSAPATPAVEAAPEPAEEPSEGEAEEGTLEAPVGTNPDEDGSIDPEEEPVINYTVDGKPATASLKEAKDALASVKHLSRLRNEIVENHKATQSQVQEVQTQRQELVGRLQEVEQLLLSGLPQPQQMQQMLDSGDTPGYLKAQQAHQRYMQVKAYREQQSEQAKQLEASARAQREQAEADQLVRARPDFAKPDYVRKVYSFLTEEHGFAADDVSSLGAKELLLADDARKWQEWNRNKALGIQKAVATATQPSKAPQPRPANERQIIDLRQRLKQSGSQEDAIQLLRLKRQQQMRG